MSSKKLPTKETEEDVIPVKHLIAAAEFAKVCSGFENAKEVLELAMKVPDVGIAR